MLTFAIQLACFRYAWVRSGCTYPRMAGTIGHSQGVAAALVVALASCEHSFTEHACVFGRVLLPPRPLLSLSGCRRPIRTR